MRWPSISRVSFMKRCGQARRVAIPYRKGMRVRMLNMRRSMALTWSMGITLSSGWLHCQNDKWVRSAPGRLMGRFGTVWNGLAGVTARGVKHEDMEHEETRWVRCAGIAWDGAPWCAAACPREVNFQKSDIF